MIIGAKIIPDNNVTAICLENLEKQKKMLSVKFISNFVCAFCLFFGN